MPSVLIVEKNGTIKPYGIKSYVEEDLFKKAGFKTPDGFQRHAVWSVELHETVYHVGLYGKLVGRANTENKYDFPPPVDGLLFFGNCVLVNKTADGIAVHLSLNEWASIYRKLFGGFHDLNEAHSSSEEEVDTDEELAQVGAAVKLTREGYVDDGFVVDDSEEVSAESSEEEIPVAVASKKKSVSKKVTSNESVVLIKSAGVDTATPESDHYLDCTKELEEEEYL